MMRNCEGQTQLAWFSGFPLAGTGPGGKKTRYSLCVRQLVRQNLRCFLPVTLAGLALRLFFLLKFPHVTADSTFYADLAKNWLLHGIYGLTTDPGQVSPTYARLPGYPGFLVFVFAVFGIDNFRAAMILQILVDLATCILVADLARRMLGSARSAKAALAMAALCPFLAQYAAAALTETLEIFFTALAMDYAVIGLQELEPNARCDASFHLRELRPWIGCGLAVAACVLLRPDGGLLLVAIGMYLGLLLLRRSTPIAPGQIVRAGITVATCALAPLLLWGIRNLHTLHRLELLAPRYATEENEYVPLGYNRWVNTWIADYTSTEEIYWNMPGDQVDPNNLPTRAFDTADQRNRTLQLLDDYNQRRSLTPDLDARFAALAEERVRAHPLRYYLILPALKIADMWLRPRTELLPPDIRWYELDDDFRWLALDIGFGILNLAYVVAAIAGWARSRPIPWAGIAISYIVLRSLFLATMPNPEPRYTLECYPAVIVLAAGLCKETSSSD
ncbi:MAG TPA: glycosyltransferase family 39 protein [Terriglobales bacterium]|nr:glycosyltransferase family 39 protein [Terriglobales bacterium]